ncbi:MAG: DNA endonuclease [Thaumarchaeota archaeon]|nr:DNA endonuclease [Nitrososphaerota archaeon]
MGKASLGRKRFPLDLRLALFEEVLRLKKEYLSYGKIISEIEERHNVTLAKGTISGWVNGTSTPFKAGHVFFPRPTPELAYAIGVKTGDALLNVKAKTYQYRIRLQAVDREFVEAFNRAVAKILGCAPHRLLKGDTAREIHVEFGSYLLHKFLERPLGELAPFIEHDKRCVAAFLRGFFDSEGSVAVGGSVTASNSSLELLGYVRLLLSKYFGIETTGPHLYTRKGSLMMRRGRLYRRNVDCFSIYVKRRSLEKFSEEIGLTIERKSLRLKMALASSKQDFE